MSRVRVHNFSVSLDGFGSGEGQSLEASFGHAGHRLNERFLGNAADRAGDRGAPGIRRRLGECLAAGTDRARHE